MTQTDAELAVLLENLAACDAGRSEHWWLGAFANPARMGIVR